MATAESDRILQALTQSQSDPQRAVLITGGYVVSMDPSVGDAQADVLIRGSRIEQVGPGLAAQAGDSAVIVDAAGCVVLPGLIDSHVHAWEGQLRGSDPAADFGAYMSITHGGVAEHMTPADIAIGQRITAAQAVNGGVTTIVDNSHNSRTPEHSDAAIEALRQAGIRAVHAVGSPVAGTAGTHLPADLLRLRDQYFTSADQLLTLRMFDITPSPDSWRFASQNGIDVVAEMGMWVPDLDTLLATKLMGPGHTYNHCSGLTGDQWDRIADSGAAVNMVPRSDSHFGLGAFIPVLEALRRNLQIGLSCDNEISYGYDIFTEMRVLLTVQRGLSFQAEWAGEADVPGRFGPLDVLRAATTGGALNAGLTSVVGSITPGKKADVLVLDLNHVHTRPFGSWVGTVVNYANVANVRDVFIDGIPRKWAGQLVGVDYDALVTEAETSRERLWGALGATLDDIRSGRGPLVGSRSTDDKVSAIVTSSNH
jgi:cytosine/adenosine deaminase-related metal-dependent hydrolase